jgi:hypothetical protein
MFGILFSASASSNAEAGPGNSIPNLAPGSFAVFSRVTPPKGDEEIPPQLVCYYQELQRREAEQQKEVNHAKV